MARSNIGLNDKYNFGVEIEFAGVGLLRVYSDMLSNVVPVYYTIDHKRFNFTFKEWCLDIDTTVTDSSDNMFIGGEASSRILSDNSYDWNELKIVCELIKNCGGKINDKCSTHINVDISKYLNNPLFFEVLSKVIAIYEIDMSLFYMGDEYNKRSTKDEYAKNISFDLIKKLYKFNFNRKDIVDVLINDKKCFRSRDGVNFSKINDKGIIEFRYPNGTLDFDIMQNYINFTLKLIDAVGEGKFDLEYLNYLLDCLVENPLFLFKYLNSVDTVYRFEELTDIISFNSYDKDSFCSQYEKVISTRNRKRS